MVNRVAVPVVVVVIALRPVIPRAIAGAIVGVAPVSVIDLAGTAAHALDPADKQDDADDHRDEAALQLAALGASHLLLVDFDTVEVSNLAPQGFLPSELGRPKIEAVAQQCHAINPAIKIDLFNQRFNRSIPQTDVMFCCVDSIQARKRIYEQVRPTAELYLDARMSAEVVRTLAVDGDANGERYLQTCSFRSSRPASNSVPRSRTGHARCDRRPRL